jgi:hypothetical protein
MVAVREILLDSPIAHPIIHPFLAYISSCGKAVLKITKAEQTLMRQFGL